jgi:putative hydrolase of the HAD superfamily
MSKYKAIIFDLFGTLVDSYDVIGYTSALRETSSLLKIPHEQFAQLWNDTAERRTTGVFKTLEDSLEYICRELNIPVKKFDINLAKMVRYDYISLSLTPRQYAIEVLSQLKANGYKMALVSNCSSETPDLWPVTPFAPFFETVLFSSVTGILKPDPRIYLLAAEKLGLAPEACLYVDDTARNLAAASGAGMSGVLFRNPEETDDPHVIRPKEEWDGTSVTSLPEVLDLLDNENHEI